MFANVTFGRAFRLAFPMTALARLMGDLITQMVIAQGKALREERLRTLRQCGLKDEQSALSYGSFI